MIGRLGRGAVRALNRALPSARGGVTVLAYHLVGGRTRAAVDLPLPVFQEQMEWLAASGRVVSLGSALELLDAGSEADRSAVVLTFDDAFRNFFQVAWPLLRELSLPATLYVPVGFIEESSPAPLDGAEELPPMTWEQLREVAASGLVTIGSHGVTHSDLRLLSQDACRRELADSRRTLEERVGTPVSSFCYPRALWSPEVTPLVGEVYDSAVAAGGRRNRAGGFDRHLISRLPLRSDGPRSLAVPLSKEVWVEEWIADRWRRRRS